ncbi:MAG: hypothetical protein PHE06_14045 [Lachnospiraceae bacterium]|nr:hypothetical protein [Lachnospiraceae bacterium]MDD3797055.1 hypothetical protein [Lachnospiraceae bacterium]
MRKKLLALFVTGAILAANTTVFFAEEAATEAESITAVVFDETNASFEGTWVPFEAGFQLYIPSDWSMLEISEENAAQGLMFQAGNEDGQNIAVTATEVTDAETLEEIQAQLATVYTSVEIADFNDIGVVTYVSEEDGVIGIAFMDTDGIMYTANAGPVSEDTESQNIAYDMLTSLSLLEETAEN